MVFVSEFRQDTSGNTVATAGYVTPSSTDKKLLTTQVTIESTFV